MHGLVCLAPCLSLWFPLSLCTGWHQEQRRRHAMAQTRAIEPKRIRNASAIVVPNPSKLADCLCQTVRQCCLELGLGTISTSAMCQNCSCFRMGFHGLPRGVPKGVSEGFPGVPGGFLPDFTLGLFTMNYVFVGFCSSKSDKTGVSKRIRVSLL